MPEHNSWESQVIDDLIATLKADGRIGAVIKNKESIGKGLTEDFPGDVGQNLFPHVRITWLGTEEEDSPADNYSERYQTINLAINVAVNNNNEANRLDELSDICERLKNAIYSHELDTGGLVLDRIEIPSVEVAPDILSHPYGFAIITVAMMTITERDNRTGR